MKSKDYRISSVTIEKRTDLWLQQTGMKPSFIVNNAPEWYERLQEQTKELKELREFKATADIKINRLQTENIDLLRFRVKAIQKLYGKEKE